MVPPLPGHLDDRLFSISLFISSPKYQSLVRSRLINDLRRKKPFVLLIIILAAHSREAY